MASKLTGIHYGDGSNLTGVTAVGTSTTGSKTTHTTAYGSIQLGPMNSSWTHIYTTANTNFYFNKDIYVLGHRVWHANNDGQGSGLDADKVDGIHASQLLRSDTSGVINGELNVSRNGGATGSTAPSYSQANIELQTASNHVPAISFHRGGYSATTLYELDGELYANPWISRGQAGKLLSSGNYGTYALPRTGGSMTGVIDMGNGIGNGYRFNGRSFSWNSSMQNPNSYVPHIMQQSYTGWDPVMGIKTTNGFWQFGAYSSDRIHFGYMAGAFGSHPTNGFDHQFQFNKDGSFLATGDITAYSDERLKDNIEVIDGALDKVKQVRGVTFERKVDGARGTGVVAQELQQVLPEAVHADDEGMLNVAYGNVVGVLIEAIKELEAKVVELEEKLNNGK